MLVLMLILGIAIGFCIAASQPCPPTFAPEAAELRHIRGTAEAWDNRMDRDERVPDGDDYNYLIALIGRNPS